MFSATAVFAMILAYFAFLLGLAQYAERKRSQGIHLADNRWVYSLSFPVLLTAWTFYGSVGVAATQGLSFLGILLGEAAAPILGWIVLRRLIRLKQQHRMTSIADFISARYGKSELVGTIVTLICIVAIIPYIALQLKSITSSVEILIESRNTSPAVVTHVQIVVSILLAFFTIVFGLRRMDPTGRHPGMMVSLAAESVIKLAGMLLAGVFVVYFLFKGIDDIGLRASQVFSSSTPFLGKTSGSNVVNWICAMLLGISADLLLPRQFHVAVIEASHIKNVKTLMWSFPLYQLAINFFVFPIAIAGLALGFSPKVADTFVLAIPMKFAPHWIPGLIFIGGLAASTGMVLVEIMTISTMFTNHLLLPVIARVRFLEFLQRHILKFRWLAAIFLMAASYAYLAFIREGYALVSMGLIAVVGVFQFLPAFLGGLFWTRGNRAGAILGLLSGFAVWAYTLFLPAFIKQGLMFQGVLERGPFGIGFLRPERLFGLGGLTPFTHSIIWTLLFNGTAYVLGSLWYRPNAEEAGIAEEYCSAQLLPTYVRPKWTAAPHVEVQTKKTEIKKLFLRFFSEKQTDEYLQHCFASIKVSASSELPISLIELTDLYTEVERTLAASIGSAAAHVAMKQSEVITERESHHLKLIYAENLAELRIPPSELHSKINLYREREKLLQEQTAEARSSQERLQAIIDGTTSIIFMKDLKGRYLLVNRRFEQVFEVKKDWVIGKTDYDIAPAKVAGQFRASDVRVFESKASFELEQTVPQKDGLHTYLVTKVPIKNAFGHVYAVCGISTDITERKRAETERESLIAREREARIEAEKSLRMRDEFILLASHELRTPITPLRMKLQMLNKLTKEVPAASFPKIAALSNVLNSAEAHMNRFVGLLEALFDVSQLTLSKLVLHLSETDLSRLVYDLVGIYHSDIEKAQCDLELNIEPEIIGHWDRYRIEQIFTNLLTNAIKFGPKNKIEISVSKEADKAKLIVRDHGIGIPLEVQARIFGRFERFVPLEHYGGLGLGLYITQKLVSAHEGTISVESDPGHGSTFIVKLPFSGPKSQAHGEPDSRT